MKSDSNSAAVAAAIREIDGGDRAALRSRETRRQLTQEIIRVFELAIRRHLDQWYHSSPSGRKNRAHPHTEMKNIQHPMPITQVRPSLGVQCWMLVVGCFLCIHTSARAAETHPALTAWLHAQTNLQTWSADVTQTRTLKTLTQPLTNTGRIWFAAPNRFRWEIGTPAQTIAVRQTAEMLVIYPRLKRAERYPLTAQAGQWKEMLALMDAGFPRNESDLQGRFKILALTGTNEVHHVALQPKSAVARRMMPLITISFLSNDFSLRATELQFTDGSTMRNEFSNAAVNPKIDAATFAPVLDADYKIVEPLKK
jgi:outer membrane lipoprotein-sorting protein